MAFINFQPQDYFNTKLYTGNGSTNAITSVGFEPSWTWIKNRGDTHAHVLVDAVRGVTKELRSSGNNAEITTSNSFTSFDSDGFTLGADSTDSYNKNSNNYVAWNWKANGQGSSNTDGSITSTVSANTTSGFSIVKWTGTGASATVGHGLGVTPDMIICKNLDGTAEDWVVWNNSFSASQFIRLNTTASVATSTGMWDNTLPTSSVFSLKNEEKNNNSGHDIIAYCFAEKKGFSKFGSYIGNGSTWGTFVNCGFKPALLIRKRTDATNDWYINDNKRAGYNPQNDYLFPNSTQAESALQRFDLLSNGFKIRTTDGGDNASGGTYIYMAFSEESIVSSNGVPATAR